MRVRVRARVCVHVCMYVCLSRCSISHHNCENTPLHSAHIASFCLRNNLRFGVCTVYAFALSKFNGYFYLILTSLFRFLALIARHIPALRICIHHISILYIRTIQIFYLDRWKKSWSKIERTRTRRKRERESGT